MSIWNQFDNFGDRTNNRVEGDNAKMKLFCGAADPKINKACNLLRTHESSATDKYNNSKKSTATQPRMSIEKRLQEDRYLSLLFFCVFFIVFYLCSFHHPQV